MKQYDFAVQEEIKDIKHTIQIQKNELSLSESELERLEEMASQTICDRCKTATTDENDFLGDGSEHELTTIQIGDNETKVNIIITTTADGYSDEFDLCIPCLKAIVAESCNRQF